VSSYGKSGERGRDTECLDYTEYVNRCLFMYLKELSFYQHELCVAVLLASVKLC